MDKGVTYDRNATIDFTIAVPEKGGTIEENINLGTFNFQGDFVYVKNCQGQSSIDDKWSLYNSPFLSVNTSQGDPLVYGPTFDYEEDLVVIF